MVIDVPLTDPQAEFVFSDAVHPAIIGGLGSGKSRAGTFRLICKILEHPGLNGGYYMPTYDLIKLRAMPGIEEDLNMLGLKYRANMSDYSIHIAGYGSIILRSYDRPERIVAYETAHSIVDELDTLPKEKAALVWRKITERNRQKSPTPNSIGAVTTPDQGFSGFIYDRWVARADDSTQLIKAATTSNPFLPADYVDNIRRNYDPALAEMYINGEFVSLTANKVYHYFGRTTHNTGRTIQPGDTLRIGLDFNIGGCCATVSVDDGDCVSVVDEFVSQDTRDFINQLARYDGHPLTVYPDASGHSGRTNASASDISIIEAAGYSVDAPTSNPFVRDRINSVNSMLSHGRLRVNTAKCPKLTQALETQGYTDKGEPEKFNAHPAIDDWNDCLGYFISRCYPIIRPASNFQIRW
ncbi:MAG: terminase large subunit domain-containing protein [Aeromonadaceae bacterium]